MQFHRDSAEYADRQKLLSQVSVLRAALRQTFEAHAKKIGGLTPNDIIDADLRLGELVDDIFYPQTSAAADYLDDCDCADTALDRRLESMGRI